MSRSLQDRYIKACRELQQVNDAITAHNLTCPLCQTMAGKRSCPEWPALRAQRQEGRDLVQAALVAVNEAHPVATHR